MEMQSTPLTPDNGADNNDTISTAPVQRAPERISQQRLGLLRTRGLIGTGNVASAKPHVDALACDLHLQLVILAVQRLRIGGKAKL